MPAVTRILRDGLRLVAGFFMFVASAWAEPPVTVFAAASLTDALSTVGRLYEDQAQGRMRFSFASSSTLARQIEQGAPADIFVSAAPIWMTYLVERGAIAPGNYATVLSNRLVLVAPRKGPTTPPADITVGPTTDLLAMLGAKGRLSVGDPAHVPAGIYAKEALQGLGLWGSLRTRLARTDNVRAALVLVARGEAPLGIVYATDALLTADVSTVAAFPPSSHSPIRYPMALVGTPRPAARRAYEFLLSEGARAIYAQHGFGRPD